MQAKQLAQDALVAAAVSYAATKVMEQLGTKTYQWTSEQARTREDEVRPGPPFVLAADNLATRVLGLDLDEDRRMKAGMALHYLSGVAWVPVYMWLRCSAGMTPVTPGLAAGLSQSLLLDEAITPAIGASAPNRDHPPVTHLRGVVNHLGYGLALAGVVEAAWGLLGRRP